MRVLTRVNKKSGNREIKQIAEHISGSVFQIAGDFVQIINKHIPRYWRFIGVTSGIALLLLLLLTVNGTNLLNRFYQEWYCGENDTIPDIRISVSGFVMADTVDNVDAKELLEWETSLAQKLEQSFLNDSSSIVVQVWSGRCTQPISGHSPDEWAQSAQSIANDTLSSIVVYGSVEKESETDVIVQPYYYINLQNAYETYEILGPYALGSSFHITGLDPTARRLSFGKNMLPKIALLSKVSVGVTYFSIQDYAKAEEMFESALSLTNDANAQKMLLVLSGNAAGELGDLELAQRLYQRALTIDPEYARAYIGLGGILYEDAYNKFNEQRASNTLDATALGTLLVQSQKFFERAISSKNIPPFAAINEKAHFGLGQVATLQFAISQKPQYLGIANEHFLFVTNSYETTHLEQVRILAAESYARLGGIAALVNECSLALDMYQNAYDLTWESDRKVLYLGRISEIKQRLSDDDRCVQYATPGGEK